MQMNCTVKTPKKTFNLQQQIFKSEKNLNLEPSAVVKGSKFKFFFIHSYLKTKSHTIIEVEKRAVCSHKPNLTEKTVVIIVSCTTCHVNDKLAIIIDLNQSLKLLLILLLLISY